MDLSLPSERTVRALEQIIDRRGKPSAIRCDYGTEYPSAAIVQRADAWSIKREYIQPGKPQQNAYVERFDRTALRMAIAASPDDLDHVQRVVT